MKFSEYLKSAFGVAFVAVVAFGYYWFELRSHPEEKDTPGQALVIVTKSTNACFSDMVRVTGFIVPRREAQVGVDQEGSRVTDLFVKEGDTVTENQELARLTAPPQPPGAPGGRTGPISLRAPASPQAGPMFRISVNNEIEVEAEVRAFICSSSIRVLRCASAVTTRPTWSARSGRFRHRSTAPHSSARSGLR